MLCDRCTAVISGMEDKSAEKVVQADLIACAQPAGHFIPVEIGSMLADRDRIIQIAVFQCEICRHDLGRACRIKTVVKTKAVHYLLIAQIEKSRRMKRILVCKTVERHIVRSHAEILRKQCALPDVLVVILLLIGENLIHR